MPDSRWTRVGVRHSYNTKQHRFRAVRTPGGKLVSQRVYKRGHGVKCSDCKQVLQGIPMVKHYEWLKQRQRKVSRAYGGSCCAKCVQQRIVRAFLLEEQKAVKKVLQEKSKAASSK
jgi:large subunit ribosomal protein L34e